MFNGIKAVIFDWDDTLCSFKCWYNQNIDVYWPITKLLLNTMRGRYDLKVGVITNSSQNQLPRINNLFKFDHVIFGGDLGEYKPSKIPFLLMCIELGIKPNECIMVGDKPEVDLIPAKQLGMRTVLFDSSGINYEGQYFKQLGYIDYIISDYDRLLYELTKS